MVLTLDALHVIKDLIRRPGKSSERRRAHFADVASSEIFLEATPTVFIQIGILYAVSNQLFGDPSSGEAGKAFELFVGGLDQNDVYLFLISFLSSIFSSAFGISRLIIIDIPFYIKISFKLRALLFGVCRTISPTGPLDGILGGRFIIVFLASLFSIIGKGYTVGVLTALNIPNSIKVVVVLTLFTPQLIMSLFSTMGFNKKSFKVIFHHPDLILMPTGIHILGMIL